MMPKENHHPDLRSRLEHWLERQYGHAATASDPSHVTTAPRPTHLPEFTWKAIVRHEPGLPTAVGIRATQGHPSCYELVEALRSGRQRHTFWSFDAHQGWRRILDV